MVVSQDAAGGLRCMDRVMVDEIVEGFCRSFGLKKGMKEPVSAFPWVPPGLELHFRSTRQAFEPWDVKILEPAVPELSLWS